MALPPTSLCSATPPPEEEKPGVGPNPKRYLPKIGYLGYHRLSSNQKVQH